MIYIGSNHNLHLIVAAEGGPVIGYAIDHKTLEGAECSGTLAIEGAGGFDATMPRWTLVEGVPTYPLTLSPSVLCPRCGDHGWVRDGKWIPA